MSRVCLCLLLTLAACGPSDNGSNTVIRHRSDGSAGTDGARDASVDGDAKPLTVTLSNVSSGDTIPYPIALLHGQTNSAARDIQASVGVSETSWPMREGTFFAAVRLEQGSNSVVLRVGEEEHSLELTYEPQTNEYAVRFVYLLAADGDGSFQAPDGEANSAASAKARIALGAELVQSWLGEVSHRAGYGRRTFRILRTEGGDPIVVELRSPKTRAELSELSPNELWSDLYTLLGEQPNRDKTVDHVTIAPSRYSPDTMMVVPTAVLDGGRLGTKPSTQLHTWAPSLDEVARRFTDGNVLDGTTFHDDSFARQRVWANYATTLGLVGYHLSRMFGLSSTEQRTDIVDRGFDNVNRWFVAYEPPSATGDEIAPIASSDQPMFGTANALWWSHSRYTSLTATSYATDTAPVIVVGETDIAITSSSKIAMYTVLVEGRITNHKRFDTPPASHKISITDLRETLGEGTAISIRALDLDGNYSTGNLTL